MTPTFDQMEAKPNRRGKPRAKPDAPIPETTPPEAETRTALPAIVARPESLPLLLSVPEACRQLGGIKKTAFYGSVKYHKIKIVHLGGRALIPREEIERVVRDLLEASPTDRTVKAKAIAALSVEKREKRRERRGSST